MATSPDIVRVSTEPTASYADTVLDNLRESVIVVDARGENLPVVLVNASARRFLCGGVDDGRILDPSLYGLLDESAAATVDATLAILSRLRPSASRFLTWRCAHRPAPVTTEFKMLDTGLGQRLIMLTLAAAAPRLDLSGADKLPVDLLILDRNLKVTHANAPAARSSASTPAELLGRSALTVVPTAALHLDFYRRAMEGIACHDDAVELLTSGGASRWFDIHVQPLMGASGVVGLVVLSTEVTERRLQDPVQPTSERRLLALTRHAHDIITVAGPYGEILSVSGGITNLLGYTPDERRSQNIFDIIHEDDRDELRAKFRRLIQTPNGGFTHELRLRHKDGSYRWLESSYASATDNPLVGGVVINSRDITERKQTELRLAQREETFRLAAAAVDGVIFEWDIARGAVHRTYGVREVLGIDPEEFKSGIDAWRERMHPRDLLPTREKIALALVGGRGWTVTYRVRDAHGRYRSMLERAIIQRDAGGTPVRAVSCSVDVSEINRLTDLLAETQRAAGMGGWEYLYLNSDLTWTDEMYRIYETTPEEFTLSYAAVLARCTDESRQRFHDACRLAEATDGHLDLELEITTFKNNLIWVRCIGNFEMLDGRPCRAYGSVQDIQAQKLSQLALESSTDWLKLSMNMAHMHAWRWDQHRDLIEFAAGDGEEGQVASVFPGIQRLKSRVHPDDLPAVNRAIERAVQERREVREEFRLRSNRTSYRSYATIARPLFDAQKRIRGLVGVTEDVTERRESEVRLRRSEELLRATTSNTADVLILVDTDLRIRFVNRILHGKTPDELIGCDMGDIVPATARDLVLARLHHTLQTGETTTYEFACLNDKQELHSYENRAMLVRDRGVATGISVAGRNITERRQLERQVLEIANRERQSIGRDLHDGLGQELTGVALMLRGLATKIQQACPEAVDSVNEIVGLVNQSIESARALAKGLLPVSSERGGLADALSALANRSRDLYGLEVFFRADVWPDTVMSEAVASHLYRIAQEALTNAERHGLASHVDIQLTVSNTHLLLRIADDGEGIGTAAGRKTGMGLKIMEYRAGIIGARLEIVANAPHGTVVTVRGEYAASLAQVQLQNGN